jgi:hypothetical protein
VHPLQFAVVARDREVVEFQVVQKARASGFWSSPGGEAPTLETRLRAAIEQRLRDLGVAEPAIHVERPDCARAPAERQAPNRRRRPPPGATGRSRL